MYNVHHTSENDFIKVFVIITIFCLFGFFISHQPAVISDNDSN